MRCFRNVLLGGGARRAPGYAGQIAFLGWLGECLDDSMEELMKVPGERLV